MILLFSIPLGFFIWFVVFNKQVVATPTGNFYVNSSDLELCKLSFSRFGAKLWDEIPCNIRQLPKNKFKKTLRKLLFDILNSEDDYIDTPTLIKKVKLARNVEK